LRSDAANTRTFKVFGVEVVMSRAPVRGNVLDLVG
jgi:hypothetical protein